jgi:hypothetical protein
LRRESARVIPTTRCAGWKNKNPAAKITMHNILREYLAKFRRSHHGSKAVSLPDAPQNLLSQLEGYDYRFR